MDDRVRLIVVLSVVLLVGALIGSSLDQWFTGSSRPAIAAPADSAPTARLRVEVLNAGGRDGMARHAREVLLSRGFDVVYYGNATEFDRDSSEVVVRSGEAGFGDQVGDVLGISARTVDHDPGLYLDVTVYLGADWDPSDVQAPEPGEDGDLRAVTPGRETKEPEAR